MMSWRRGQAYAQHLRDRASGHGNTGGRPCFGVIALCLKSAPALQPAGQTSAGGVVNHVPLRLAAALRAQVALASEQTLAQLCCWAHEAHRR
jgi:hypothetical protein